MYSGEAHCMTNEIRITLRPKEWFWVFGISLSCVLIMGYVCISVILDKNNPNPILGPILCLFVFGALFY